LSPARPACWIVRGLIGIVGGSRCTKVEAPSSLISASVRLAGSFIARLPNVAILDDVSLPVFLGIICDCSPCCRSLGVGGSEVGTLNCGVANFLGATWLVSSDLCRIGNRLVAPPQNLGGEYHQKRRLNKGF
jgi:hypothetical protein